MKDMRRFRHLVRRARPLAFWAVAGLSLLVAHDLVILAQVGPGAELSRALRSGAHDYWGAASAALLLIGLLAAAVVAYRVHRLRRTAGRLQAVPEHRSRRKFAARIPGLWLRLFAVVAVGFTVQENLEHFVGHAHVLGAGALIGPEYPLALPVIGLITLLAAAITALAVVVERELVTAIALALASARRRAPRTLRRAPLRDAVRQLSVLARLGAGRAPPSLLFVPC
jgi:hypothetical protein